MLGTPAETVQVRDVRVVPVSEEMSDTRQTGPPPSRDNFDAGGIAVEGQTGRSVSLPDVKRLGIVSVAWSMQRCLADGRDATRHQLPIHMGTPLQVPLSPTASNDPRDS